MGEVDFYKRRKLASAQVEAFALARLLTSGLVASLISGLADWLEISLPIRRMISK
jgi:hypothetical protein